MMAFVQRKRWSIRLLPIPVALTLGMGLLSAASAADSEQHGSVVVTTESYELHVDSDGLRHHLRHPGGRSITRPHPASGVRIAPHGTGNFADVATAELTEQNDEELHFEAELTDGSRAEVVIAFEDHRVRFDVRPDSDGSYDIQVRTAGGMDPTYGLGDHGYGIHFSEQGGHGANLNVYGTNREIYQHQRRDPAPGPHSLRFLSTFSVFPAHSFAQVLFDQRRKTVRIDDEATALGVIDARELSGLYYFVGDMETIYSEYKDTRHEEGYLDKLPDREFFGVGFESYGALSWNTNQQTVTDMLTRYLDNGYPLRWAVVGSGFWPNRGGDPEGLTTSFGMWGESWPDPEAFKSFLDEHDLKLILGLRHGFAALPEHGGPADNAIHGPFPEQGIENGYFLTEPDGTPRTFDVTFPDYPVYLLDPHNSEAVEWYRDGVDLWGADGFKEDFMFFAEDDDYYDDARHNPILEDLADSGYMMMVRAAAYSVPGSILRINDTDINHSGHDQDRLALNGLAYAASGQPNFYPDIAGGRVISDWTDASRRYLARAAMLGAVSPSMSFGNPPWNMEDDRYEEATLTAAKWHEQHLPYIYSAAVDSFETGYPHTATPLPIAFPGDANTYNVAGRDDKQYQWMLGPSLLVHPLMGSDFATADSRDVYLPEGKWIHPRNGLVIHGPSTLKDLPIPVNEVPVFVGGKGVVVTQDEKESLIADVYPIARGGSTYRYTDNDAKTRSTIVNDNTGWDLDALSVTDETTGRLVDFAINQTTGAISFPLVPGHDYRLTGGGDLDHPFPIEQPATPLSPTGLDSEIVDGEVVLSWEPVDGAEGYVVFRRTPDSPEYRAVRATFGAEATSVTLGGSGSAGGSYAVKSVRLTAQSPRSASHAVSPTGVPFADEFNDLSAWTRMSGTWNAVDRQAVESSPPSAGARLTLNDAQYRDGVAEVTIGIDEWQSDTWWAALTFRTPATADTWNSDSNTVLVRRNGEVALIESRPGQGVTHLGAVDSGIDPATTPVRLRVHLDNDQINVYVGDDADEAAISVSTDRPIATYGYFHLITNRTAARFFGFSWTPKEPLEVSFEDVPGRVTAGRTVPLRFTVLDEHGEPMSGGDLGSLEAYVEAPDETLTKVPIREIGRHEFLALVRTERGQPGTYTALVIDPDGNVVLDPRHGEKAIEAQ